MDKIEFCLSNFIKDSFLPAVGAKMLPAVSKPSAWPARTAQLRPRRTLNIDPKRIYKWQKEAITTVAATRKAELDLATVAELRAVNRRRAQELDSKKSHRHLLTDTGPISRYRFIEVRRARYLMRLLCLLAPTPVGRATNSLSKDNAGRTSSGNGVGQGIRYPWSI